MRKRGLAAIHDLARENREVLYIGSDVGKGTLSEFQQELPRQYFVEGIAEAHVIGMAAGLAANGKVPFVNTIATFLTRRCYDQLAVDVCLGNRNVRLYANGGGLVYAPLGPTHLATDDLALMCALPNMTVIAPCDADEMERAIRASANHQGPIYFRVARGGDKIVSNIARGFAIGKAVVMREGSDLLLITTGVTCQIAMEVAEVLAQEGIRTTVIHNHTVKPLDTKTLIEYLKITPYVMTLEEHTLQGGLGLAVARLIAEGARHRDNCFQMLGIPDVFPDGYGRQENLMAKYGLDRDSVLANLRSWMK